MNYQTWKKGRILLTSFDHFKRETGAKEYECRILDPELNLYWVEGAPNLFETDDLGEACNFIYLYFNNMGIECGIWQERTQGWRGYYKFEDDDSCTFTSATSVTTITATNGTP